MWIFKSSYDYKLKVRRWKRIDGQRNNTVSKIASWIRREFKRDVDDDNDNDELIERYVVIWIEIIDFNLNWGMIFSDSIQ